MATLIDGKYKIKFGENDEGKIVVIDEFGNLLTDDKKKFIWNNDNYNWMDNEEKNIIIVKSPISFIGSGDKKYPVKFNIVKSNVHDGIYINGELELIDFEKLKGFTEEEKKLAEEEKKRAEEEEKRRRRRRKKEKIIRYSIFFVSGLIFILFFYTGLVNNNLISNKFLSNKIFKITSKIFNLLNIFLISLIIPTLIILYIEN